MLNYSSIEEFPCGITHIGKCSFGEKDNCRSIFRLNRESLLVVWYDRFTQQGTLLGLEKDMTLRSLGIPVADFDDVKVTKTGKILITIRGKFVVFSFDGKNYSKTMEGRIDHYFAVTPKITCDIWFAVRFQKDLKVLHE